MSDAKADAKAIFLEALDCQGADELRRFLEQACGPDAALRTRVEELLRAHREAGAFLGGPEKQGATCDQPIAERPGTVIGPYKLLEPIGEGGMGTVWMAQQTEPVKRLVAVKLIKAGMDSRQVIARFEAERQALALMDHANIARVLDAGTTSAGRPYFVMDLVKGVPITRYCDQHRLTPRQRLELFVPVCQAVQHAHQKGIIHRDLKPSNVLVALYDGKPVPKVIDFGVAKAAGQSLTDKTLVTGFGAIVGTLEYMSPEQAEVNQLDIDTRSDIYSLGVLLYELLAGSPPFSRKELEKAGMLEMLRVIREQEPSKPSAKLSTAEGLPTLAANRGTEPAKLRKLVRGELDWIVMKALEKDRSRRYETANGFARDVERHLADEPVQACPPSAWYRLRKFSRRNKAAFTAAALVLMALVLGTAVSTWQAIRATTAEGLAENRLESERLARHALDAARSEQDRQRTSINRKLSRALVDVAGLREKSKNARPSDTGPWNQLREALREAEALAGSELADPDLVGRVQVFLVDLKQDEADRSMLSRLEKVRLSRRPSSDYEAVFRDFGLPIFELEVEEAARRIGKSSIRDSLVAALDQWAGNDGPLCSRLLPIARRLAKDGWPRDYYDARIRGHGQTLLRLAKQPEALEQPPSTLSTLAGSLQSIDLPKAVDLLRVAQRRHPDDLWINWQLAGFLMNTNEKRSAEESVGFCRAALAARPESVDLRFLLAHALLNSGHHDEAIAVSWQTIRLAPDWAFPYGHIGDALAAKGDPDGAIAAYRTAVKLDPRSVHYYWRLAEALRAKGDLGDVVAAYRKIVDLQPDSLYYLQLGRALLHAKNDTAKDDSIAYRKALEIYPERPWPYIGLGGTLRDKGDWAGAIAAYQKAINLDPKCYTAHSSLASALEGKGDRDGAIACYRKLIELDPKNGGAHLVLAEMLRSKGDLEGAIAVFRKGINPQSKLAPADLAKIYFWLADALRAKGDLDGAVAAYRKVIALNPDASTHFRLAEALRTKGDLEGGIAAYRKAIELEPEFPMAYLRLAAALRQKGDLDGAIAACRKAIELDPRSGESFLELGRALLQAKGDAAKDDVAAYRKALELYPHSPAAHLGLGQALQNKGDRAGAVAAYRKAIELDPKSLLGHSWLGFVLEASTSKADLEEAVAALSKACELNPGNSNMLVRRAHAYQKLGRWEKAVADYGKAVALAGKQAPWQAPFLNDLAWLLASCREPKVRNPGRAVQLACKAVEFMPTASRYWQTLGVAQYRAGNWKAAAAALNKSMQLGSGRDAIDWLFLAMALQQLGHHDKARKWYDQAVQWLEKNSKTLETDPQRAEELRRFQAEAEEVLELKKK
jgi:tetratricopeptide (TPR) repeat protein/serine/threonine protein kinase